MKRPGKLTRAQKVALSGKPDGALFLAQSISEAPNGGEEPESAATVPDTIFPTVAAVEPVSIPPDGTITRRFAKGFLKPKRRHCYPPGF